MGVAPAPPVAVLDAEPTVAPIAQPVAAAELTATPQPRSLVASLLLSVVLLVAGVIGITLTLPGLFADLDRAERDDCWVNQMKLQEASVAYLAGDPDADFRTLLERGWESVLVPDYIEQVPRCPHEDGGYVLGQDGRFICENGTHEHYAGDVPKLDDEQTTRTAEELEAAIRGAQGQGVEPVGYMAPTIVTGTEFELDRSAYIDATPQIGDIVYFEINGNPGIRRVVVLGGQGYDIVDGRFVVEGVPLDEPYAVGGEGYFKEDGRVWEGYVIICGDNREFLWEDVAWGSMSLRDIVGKVILRD